MLDKSIPYKNIFMKIKSEEIQKIPKPLLPEGYHFRKFREGDEKNWARVEASVLEFETDEAAEAYFTRFYLPYLDLLKERCFLLEAPQGEIVATAMAWFQPKITGENYPCLHWVSANPKYQGMGLGKAVAAEATRRFLTKEPGKDVYLHTQTWSHRAVKLYYGLGYRMCRQDCLANLDPKTGSLKACPNDYKEALEVLEPVLGQAFIRRLRETSVE